MDIGMLWYDDTKRPLDEKVTRAVEHYKAKYGAVPTVCYVNPITLKDGPETAAGVALRKARNVLVDHFWIGVGETGGNGSAGGRGASNGKRAPASSNGHVNGHGRRGRGKQP
jgi:hypothetical protein